MMEEFDSLKGSMPENTYLQLCNFAKNQYETANQKTNHYMVTCLEPMDDKCYGLGEFLRSLHIRQDAVTFPCFVKNPNKYLKLIEQFGYFSLNDLAFQDFQVMGPATTGQDEKHIAEFLSNCGFGKTIYCEDFFDKESLAIRFFSTIIVKMTPVSEDQDNDSDDE